MYFIDVNLFKRLNVSLKFISYKQFDQGKVYLTDAKLIIVKVTIITSFNWEVLRFIERKIK